MTGLVLLERERELARLSELLGRLADGEAGLAVVEGPPGAGKSALLGALSAEARKRGIRVLRASGLELERGYPFGVVRQLFEPATYDLDPSARRQLFTGAAALAAALLGGAGAPAAAQLVDPGFALVHSLYWVLVGLTDLGPVALVLDDVQWADAPSLRFLAFALKRFQELPLLVALAYRDLPSTEQAQGLAAVVSEPATVMRPAPLSLAAVGSLLTQSLGHELDEAATAEAMRLTAGNPLYVRELADSLTEARDAAADAELELLRDAAPLAIGRRVRVGLVRAGDAAQTLAGSAAILGDEVPLRRAAALAELDQESATAAADALVRADILSAGEPLRFRHPLVREAVLERIEPRARALAHRRAARVLAADGEPPERLSVHLLESDPAGDPEVVATLRAAAVRDTASGAPELTISSLRRALREPPDARERSVVLNELAMVEAQVGNPEALGHFEEAFASVSSFDGVADGAVRYAMLLVARGRSGEAGALIERVLETIGDRERRLMLEAELCTLSMTYAIPGYRERLSRITADLRGESPAERLLLGLQANDAANRGAIDAATAIERVTAALGNGYLLAELGPDSPTYLIMAGAGEWLDAVDLAERELAAAVVEARRLGAAFGLAIASTVLGVIAWKRGQLQRAEDEARTGVDLAAQMGWVAGYPVPVSYLIEILNETGDHDEADRLLRENHLDGLLPPGIAPTMLLGARGRLRLSQGRLEQGIADLEEQVARLEESGDSPPNIRALHAKAVVPALVRNHRRQEARKIGDDALRVALAFGQPRYIADCRRARALAALGGADLPELQEVAGIYERISSQLDLAHTLYDIGSTLRRRRQPAAAREPLRRALDLARACGAHPLANRAEHELRAAGARPRRDRITGRDALTPSERRIAQLAGQGLTNRQIAEALFITRKTVGSHLERVFRKLDVHARTDLVQALDAEAEPSPVT